MTTTITTVRCSGPGFRQPDPSLTVYGLDNRKNKRTPCQAYQRLLKEFSSSDVIVYCHDDLTIHDPAWLSRLTALFENPECVAAGFGGATSLGRPDLYRKRFSIWNMARGGYASNQRDAEVHGERFTGDRQVAVLDAFCMAVRVEWLRNRGGWPVEHITFHCLDLWLACEAARDDKEIWMSGVDVLHSGGGTSVTEKYQSSAWLQGGNTGEDHLRPHVWLFENYRDCLPIEVPQ